MDTVIKSMDSRPPSEHTESVFQEVGPEVCIFEDDFDVCLVSLET